MFVHPRAPPLVPVQMIPTHLPPPGMVGHPSGPGHFPMPVVPFTQICHPPPPLPMPRRRPTPAFTMMPVRKQHHQMRRYSHENSKRFEHHGRYSHYSNLSNDTSMPGCGSSVASSAASTSSSHSDRDVSSQDSGRATGGLASSLSPMDESSEGIQPQYEFEIPNNLVGLVIGVKGKTIRELTIRAGVRMLIRPHHTPTKVDSHQICQVRGKRDSINKCLCMLRRRFPPDRFPDLNLQPVMPPPLPNNLFDALHTQPTWLTLPETVPTEVVVSSMLDPGHIFIQQPTHPSFSSLSILDRYMLHLYSQQEGIPVLPKPCETGLLCAAPVLGAWFRAVTVVYYNETDEVLVRFVDYGGYTRLPRADLRQIRTDLMTLPFQAIECYMAHVQPVDGTWQWNEEAIELFKKMCMGKVIEAHMIGYHVDDKVPFIELSVPNDEGKIVRFDRVLMDAGVAKASDPSKLVRLGHVRKTTATAVSPVELEPSSSPEF